MFQYAALIDATSRVSEYINSEVELRLTNRIPSDWRDAFEKIKVYVISLERDRAALWGVNEELRNKIKSLEQGTEDLQMILQQIKSTMRPG